MSKLISVLKFLLVSIFLSHLHGHETEQIHFATQWIEQYSEILWLADQNVRQTEEGTATQIESFSEYFFGKKYLEFDRTLMKLHCLRLILNGSEEAYEIFTKAQPKEEKLSKSSFEVIHKQGQNLLNAAYKGMSPQQIFEAMETALALSDIGKSVIARERFRPVGVAAPDHDDFYGEAIDAAFKNSGLCPSFDRLPTPAQKLLSIIANLAHYGHITHLEGGTEMFKKLRASGVPRNELFAVEFDLFVHACDVAGALGHVNHQTSLAYTENTHRALQATGRAVYLFSQKEMTEKEAFESYLKERAALLNYPLQNSTDRILTRIACMLRLFSPDEGQILRNAFALLDDLKRQSILVQFDREEFDPTPTYMPAVLVNLANNPLLGSIKQERLQNAVLIGLPFIARVLQKIPDYKVPLNFNAIAGIAKSSPYSLEGDFFVDEEGIIHLL